MSGQVYIRLASLPLRAKASSSTPPALTTSLGELSPGRGQSRHSVVGVVRVVVI
jgi:hypothetical protein